MYIEKIKAPSRSMLLKGLAFHSAIETNYTQKIETEKDLPVSDVLDIFGSQFDAGVPDTQFFEDEKIGEIKDEGYGVVEAYHKKIAPTISPQSVETSFELKIKDIEQVFSGRIDLITKEQWIIDSKTTKNKPYSIDESHKLQLIAYNLGYQVINHEKPQGHRIDYVTSKKSPDCISYEFSVEDTDIDLILSLIWQYQNAMQIGIDMPNRGHFLCNRRYCSYADLCEQRYDGRVRGE
jgi:CRISPR/Cas system-associated exonuclease Cas4 (RecB family)